MTGSGILQEPWWWRDTRPSADATGALPSETDVLVVGSGYTGLSCALELARAGTDVTVIDALAIGEGASTRNAGFTAGRAGVSKQIDLKAAVGAEKAKAILCEADEAYEFLRDTLAAEAIDCDLSHIGRFVGAHTADAYRKLERKMAEYNSDGRALFAMVPPEEQGRYVNTQAYRGGMLIKNAGTLNPAKYHAGLAALCRFAGVRLIPNTRMLGIVREGQRFRLLTEKGDVTARRVALGTNGYTDKAAPWHQRRVIPISSTIIATEELSETLVRSLLPAGGAVIDAKRVLNFARPTPDMRHILFGGRASFLNISLPRKGEILRRELGVFFPALADVGLTHVWTGQMAFTFDFLPKIGAHDGVDYAVGCNGGSGIVMMSWLGRKLALRILGTANRPSAFEGLEFKTQPFYGGKPWFLPFVGNWYRFRDWLDAKRETL